MQNVFNLFFSQNNLKPVEVEDPSALDQCMDLAFKWLDTLKIDRASIRHQYAYQVWEQPTDLTRKYFDIIANNPNDTNKPSVGDLVVFKRISGIPVGHISIETGKSDGYNLVSFDQNWDTANYHYVGSNGIWIPYSRTVIHSGYYGVAGWLHPKTAVPPQPLTDAQKVAKVHEIAFGSGSGDEKIDRIKQIPV